VFNLPWIFIVTQVIFRMWLERTSTLLGRQVEPEKDGVVRPSNADAGVEPVTRLAKAEREGSCVCVQGSGEGLHRDPVILKGYENAESSNLSERKNFSSEKSISHEKEWIEFKSFVILPSFQPE
jgi:hypothetical protein